MSAGLKLPDDWIAPHLLVRQRHTAPQTALKREHRMNNLRGAFRGKDSTKIQHQTILLVDDVMTTGATADVCARALIEAGAAEVSVLTLARALP